MFYLMPTLDNFQGSKNSLYLNENKQKLYLFSTDVDTLINASQVVFCLRAAMQNLHMQKLHSLCAFPPLSALLAKNGIRTPWSQHLEKIKLSNSEIGARTKRQKCQIIITNSQFFFSLSRKDKLKNVSRKNDCLLLIVFFNIFITV